jgi:hypothetical protein
MWKRSQSEVDIRQWRFGDAWGKLQEFKDSKLRATWLVQTFSPEIAGPQPLERLQLQPVRADERADR